jgi:hypothetical protein
LRHKFSFCIAIYGLYLLWQINANSDGLCRTTTENILWLLQAFEALYLRVYTRLCQGFFDEQDQLRLLQIPDTRCFCR